MNPEPPPIADPHSTAPTPRTAKTILSASIYWLLGTLVFVADLFLIDAVGESLIKSGLQQGLTPRLLPLLIFTVVILMLFFLGSFLVRRGIRIWKHG